MRSADLLFRPVDELAALVRRGEVTALELVETSLERIAALNPTMNAFVDVFGDDARAEAAAIGPGDPRPFAGVPMAIKNNRGIAGRRLTFGSGLAAEVRAPADHNVVRRLRGAGFVIVGTTTLPEWGILPTTETRQFGATRNPWDTTRTAGGSSGGSAAAVAAGMVPAAHANDGGGSIRIPAACCGLVGLKPQRGRVSLAPTLGHAFLVQDGVLTRTVRETALLLDVLAGPEVGDVAWAPPPPDPFAAAAARAPGPRRIAWTARPPIPDAVVDPVCVQAVHDAAALLRELGHEVVEAEPPWGDPAVEDLFAASFGPGIAASIRAAAMLAGRAPAAEDVEPLSWWLYERAAALDAPSALMAELALHAVGRALVTWTSGFDAVLTPALAEAPLPLGTIDPLGPDPAATFARSARFTPFTPPLNISGQPAIALPLFARPDGLPLAVQLIGAPTQEGALLALAAQLEAARPWSGRRAPV